MTSNVTPLSVMSPPPEVMSSEELERADQLLRLGDGLPWDSDRVVREILAEQEQMVLSAARIGKRLALAKLQLGAGGFEEWVSTKLHFSRATAYRYIRVHAFFDAHPRLLKPMAGAGIKRTLLLTTLPEEELEMLAEEGQLGEVELDQLPETPYVELLKQVNELKKEKTDDQDEIATLSNKLDKANARIADLSGALSKDETDLIERFRKFKENLEDEVALLMAFAEGVGPRLEGLSSAVRVEYFAMFEWFLVRARVTQAEARTIAGERVYGNEYRPAMEMDRPYMGRGEPYELETRFQQYDEPGDLPEDVPTGATVISPTVRTADELEEEFESAAGASGLTPAAEVARRRAAMRAVSESVPTDLDD